ncbi:Protease II [Geitlerinema sp. FC II]|nr:Protease II [Geitlerinema sp. FC II]
MEQHPTTFTPANPPRAKVRPHVFKNDFDGGATPRVDNYHWLSDAENPEVIAYLEAENAYTDTMTDHLSDFRETLYAEMLGRIQETDREVPYRHGDYLYYRRTEAGKPYDIFCRRFKDEDAPEEILLDSNQLAEGCEFFNLGICAVSPNHRILAYAIDTTGDERYTLFFRDLDGDRPYPERIDNVDPSFAWGNDNCTVFYTQLDDSYRPYQVYRHRLGDDPATDEFVYAEDDKAFYLSIAKTHSDAYILLASESKVTSEIWFLDADRPREVFQVVRPRDVGIEYSLEHHGDEFYIRTNENATNFQLVKAPIARPQQWETVIPHRDDTMLVRVLPFANRLVLFERKNGLPQVSVWDVATKRYQAIAFPEPTYHVSFGDNYEFEASYLRLNYTSLVTPPSVFDYHFDSGTLELKKETPVLGYDRAQYVSERLYATASDGTQIPISVVYRRQNCDRDGSHPLWLTGYGSYGIPYPVSFRSTRVSLLDRGVVFAIAHVRGGGEMGRPWYEAGKLFKKYNTFTDFIACAEHLIAQGWTRSDRLAISGGSAGGLLVGAVLNERPELFEVAVADVPFVDVVTTILNPDLPLSAIEWDEWGNPNEEPYYNYMLSYSPYDNVHKRDYPHLLVLAGLHDARVKYWEPAKWTAKLRSLKTDDNLLLLKTNMEAGHGGASGRYGYLREIAFEYAFVLDRLQLSR